MAHSPHCALRSRPEARQPTALAYTVSDDVRTLAPGFSHLVVEARGPVNGPSNDDSSALLDAATAARPSGSTAGAQREDPHRAAWRDAYTAFGAKPSRTRSSAEALARRALTAAGLSRINLLVDLYHAISVAHLIPVGGEDTDRINGTMQLVRSTGQEPFATVAGGEEAVEHPEPETRSRRRRTLRRAGEAEPRGADHRRHCGVIFRS